MAIARALINDPEIIVADEPTANLDTALSRQFLDILTRLIDEGRTVVVTSDDPLFVDSRVVNRVVRLRDGHLVADAG